MRSRLAEWGDGSHNKARVLLTQNRISQTEVLHVPWWEGFNDEISRLSQLFEDVLPIWYLDVKGYTSLVGIIGKPVQTLLRVRDIPEKGATSGKEPGIYLVKKGESLASLSGQAAVYGNPLSWPILFRYNMNKLSGVELKEDLPDRMVPEGVRLKIVTPEEVKDNLKERADKFWVINIISTTNGKEIVPPAIKLIKGGYSVYITSAIVKGKSYQRLRVGFFKNQAEASAAGKKVMSLLKTTEFWPTTLTKNEHEVFAGY